MRFWKKIQKLDAFAPHEMSTNLPGCSECHPVTSTLSNLCIITQGGGMATPGLPVGGAASLCTEAQCHVETDNNVTKVTIT